MPGVRGAVLGESRY